MYYATRTLIRTVGIALCITVLLAARAATAQSYPTKPIRFLVPYAAGGAGDIIARTVSKDLAIRLAQQILVDNRGGANGIVASEMMANASPDGYTLMLGASSTLAANPVLYRKLPYDPVKDFASITQFCAYGFGIAAAASFPANTVPELIALAKAKPGQISNGTTGEGSPGHIGGALLEILADVKLMHIPYKGASLSVVDVLSGQVSFTMTSMALLMPNVKSGKLKLLGVTSEQRMSSHPDLPTVAEAGYKDYVASTWFAAVTRAGTPQAIIDRLNRESVLVLQMPEVKQRLEGQGYEIAYGSPADLNRMVEADRQRIIKVQKHLNLKVD